MEFVPPFCPNPACDRHAGPQPRFFVRHGFYQPACRTELVPRFRCRDCRRTFSSQTFRQDYRDRRPEVNERLFENLVSGIGYRQSARLLKMGVHAVRLTGGEPLVRRDFPRLAAMLAALPAVGAIHARRPSRRSAQLFS